MGETTKDMITTWIPISSIPMSESCKRAGLFGIHRTKAVRPISDILLDIWVQSRDKKMGREAVILPWMKEFFVREEVGIKNP